MDYAQIASKGNGTSKPIKILNFLDGTYRNEIAKEVHKGLTSVQKSIPSKYFYDAKGSKLFEDICDLPEYYLTRTEMSILKEKAPTLMGSFLHSDIVELGAGASWKIQVMLDAVGREERSTLRYLPVDISESAVIESAEDLVNRYPELDVLGIVADFTCHLDMLPTERPKMFCFLGSTIGNLEEKESISFLRKVSETMKSQDRLLVGFDMVKAQETIEEAYNDGQGVTAEFNKNILNVVNNQLGASFDPLHFDHLAFFNDNHDRIEMHLRANRDHSVKLEGLDTEVEFRKGETLHTENSRKFTKESIEDLASASGLQPYNWYADSSNWFSVVEMQASR